MLCLFPHLLLLITVGLAGLSEVLRYITRMLDYFRDSILLLLVIVYCHYIADNFIQTLSQLRVRIGHDI